jgi:N-acetylglucosamine kinase-like BadF-type ATPase
MNLDLARTVGGVGRTSEAVMSAVRNAIGNTNCGEIHIASMPLRGAEREFAEGLAAVVTHTRFSESAAAYALAGTDIGIVALSGTGAFVSVATRDGRTCHLDGLGPMLGDHGGGFQTGLMGLRAAARSDWSPALATSLAARILPMLGNAASDIGRAKRYMIEEHDRSEIAFFAKIVGEEAEKGDRVSVEIMQAAASALADTVRFASDSMGISDQDYPLIATGGLLTKSSIYWERFEAQVARFAPRFRLIRMDKPPALGHALSMMKTLPGVDIHAARDRMLLTFDHFMEKGTVK